MSGALEIESLTPFDGVLILRAKVFGDARGFFLESFNAKTFREATGLAPNFVQDNHSRSSRGVLRGIHYQLPPHAQGKLVRVVTGAVFDVAVDLRRSSPTFGKWAGHTLTPDSGQMLWIPPGFGWRTTPTFSIKPLIFMRRLPRHQWHGTIPQSAFIGQRGLPKTA